jgi:hypothetical protein
LHDPVGVSGGICVSARFIGKATLVSPGEGAVVDEGATSVALARVHQVFCSASANLIEPDLHRREPSTRLCWLFTFLAARGYRISAAIEPNPFSSLDLFPMFFFVPGKYSVGSLSELFSSSAGGRCSLLEY